MEKRLTADLNVVANSNLEIQLLDGDLNIIQKLDDEPNDVGGLTSAELKAKFDEGGNIIKKYINETLIPAVLTDDATEESRKQAEAARVAAEQGRVTAEEGRVSAETARAAAEQTRSEAEASRVSAENARAEAETARADETAGIVARATAQANAAAGSASQAAGSEQSAKDAAGTATGAASSASQSAAAAFGSASQASAAAAAAAQSAASVNGINKTAQSWAVGGTGTRPGEDTDNAKYWAEKAQAVVGGDFATKVEAQGYVTEHNESNAAHSDIREALNGKASLDADGKVPASQLPETDTYTKDEILKGSTAALLGLGTDAVPDDAFKKIWDKTAVSTRQVHVDFADMLLSGVTGIPNDILTSSGWTNAGISALSYNVSNIIKPNDMITIITTPVKSFYKLAGEEQWHVVDFTKVANTASEANVLFDYDGEYFYCILGGNTSQTSGYATSLDLKKTKDFNTFETIASYYPNMYRVYLHSIIYHIDGQLYLHVSFYSSQSSGESSMYCVVSRTALSFAPLKTSFSPACGLFGTYGYKLVNTTVTSNKVTLEKRNVLTDETTTIQVPVASTQKYVAGQYCVPIFIENVLYLFLTSNSNVPNIFIINPNYVHCLVSRDLGNTFESCDFSNIIGSGHVVLKYNSISQKMYAKSVQKHEIFEFKNGTFEKSNMDPTWWYYDYSAVHAIDEATMVYMLPINYKTGSGSGSTYSLPMTFKANSTIKMRGASHSTNVQLMTLSGSTHDINFDAVAVAIISNSNEIYIGGASPIATIFASQKDASVFTINQMYNLAGLSGNVATISTMPETN